MRSRTADTGKGGFHGGAGESERQGRDSRGGAEGGVEGRA